MGFRGFSGLNEYFLDIYQSHIHIITLFFGVSFSIFWEFLTFKFEEKEIYRKNQKSEQDYVKF